MSSILNPFLIAFITYNQLLWTKPKQTTMVIERTIFIQSKRCQFKLSRFGVYFENVRYCYKKGLESGDWLEPWASAAGGRAPPPWFFIHGTDIVDKGLIVLFFGLFSVGPHMEEV